MLSNEEFNKLYNELIPRGIKYKDASKALKGTKSEHINEIRKAFCSELLYSISQGYTKYNHAEFEKGELVNIFLENVKLLPEEYTYFHLIYHFFKDEQQECLALLKYYIDTLYNEVKEELKKPEDFINEGVFIDEFFEPFKEAFSGFWSTLAKILRDYPTQEGLPELCEIIEKYYACKTDDEALELLLNMMAKYPSIILIKELIGYTYYSMKMWNNAIAYFELIEDKSIFFTPVDLYFMMAWSHGKVKNYKTEEEFYKKSLELNPNNINTLNNLGYCLYKQKKYKDAIECFEKCLEKNINYIYASNNYIRVLIALGRNKDAKDFVKSNKYKISKDLKNRVERLDNTNTRLKKTITMEENELMDDSNSQENAIDLGIKRQQFSNEKLLEDELTARIEKGREVFGLKLKIYKRKGVYGRQFSIPNDGRRLDLLCEDTNGNLYIIELKKDSGYTDAYKQTVEYIDWFEKNEISAGKKVYGIICLNSPNKQLIDKVHKDKRIKLFEYQISYTEL